MVWGSKEDLPSSAYLLGDFYDVMSTNILKSSMKLPHLQAQKETKQTWSRKPNQSADHFLSICMFCMRLPSRNGEEGTVQRDK